MQPLMSKVGTSDGQFHDGNPATGAVGTILSAAWLNGVQAAVRAAQEEIIAVLDASGIVISPDQSNQLLRAIRMVAWGNADERPDTLSGYGIADAVPTKMVSVSSFDDSAVTESGFAMVTISAGGEGQSPTGVAGQFLVMSIGGRALTAAKAQLAIDRGTGLIYRRFMNNEAAGWSVWKQSADAATTLAGYGITDAVALAQFTGVNQLLSGNGYQRLPGGLVLQWGQIANANGVVTFPIAFPNGCAAVACTGDAGSSYIAYAKDFSKWNFFAGGILPNTGAGAVSNYRWIAVGF